MTNLLHRAGQYRQSTQPQHCGKPTLWLGRLVLLILMLGNNVVFAQIVLVRDSVIAIAEHGASAGDYQLLIDGTDATAFSILEDDIIILRNPYPKRRDTFRITVLEASSQQPLHQADYRIATPGDWFDSVDIVTSGQIDSTFVNQQQPEPVDSELDTQFDESTSKSDLLGALGITAQRGRFSSELELEAVNRTDPDATLRQSGPNADMSRFHLRNEFSMGRGTVYLRAGDVDLSASNQLVNAGMASRGFALGFRTPGERLRIEAGRVFGTDIVGTVRGPLGWSSDSYRTGFSAELDIVQNGFVVWTLNGSMVDIRRPAADNFGVSQSPVGETNKVTGVGTSLGAFNDKVRLTLSWASSEYNNPLELNQANLPDQQDETLEDADFVVFDPGATSGSAYRHGLVWDIWSGNVAQRYTSASVRLGTEKATPLYRSMQGSGTADRRQWSVNLDVAHGAVSGRIGSTRYRNNLDDLVSIHTLDESLFEIGADIDLEALHGDYASSSPLDNDAGLVTTSGWPRRLIPSSIGFSARQEELKTLNGDDIILAPVIDGFDFMDQTTEVFGLNLVWRGMYQSTSVDLGYTFLDNDQRERAAADRRDLHYGLSHDIARDNWSLGARIGFTSTDDLDDASRSETTAVEWGLSGSYTSSIGISWALNVDNNRHRINDLVFDDRQRTTSDRYSVSADFGAYLQQILNWRTTPAVVASWQRTDTDSSSNFFNTATSSSSWAINLGLSF